MSNTPHEYVDDRPWEESGSCRRDAEPHRAAFLNLLAATSVMCGLFALCVFLTGPAGLALAFAVRRMGRRDHEQMRQGRMDLRGWEATEDALSRAAVGAGLSLLGLVLGGWIGLLFLAHGR